MDFLNLNQGPDTGGIIILQLDEQPAPPPQDPALFMLALLALLRRIVQFKKPEPPSYQMLFFG